MLIFYLKNIKKRSLINDPNHFVSIFFPIKLLNLVLKIVRCIESRFKLKINFFINFILV